MGVGGGNLQTYARTIPPTAATVTNANSGTHLNGTIVQLGSNGGFPLLQNTDIDLNGFYLDIIGNTIEWKIDDATSTLVVVNGIERFFEIDIINGIFFLGTTIGNLSSILINDSTQQAFFSIANFAAAAPGDVITLVNPATGEIILHPQAVQLPAQIVALILTPALCN